MRLVPSVGVLLGSPEENPGVFMNKVVSIKAAREKVRKSFSEYYDEYRSESDMEIVIHQGDPHPELMMIELSGPIARIPSLKNANRSSATSRSFMATDVKARLRVMDDLYREKMGQLQVSFGEIPVWVLLITGERSRAFDEDNCMACVRDWLEPSEIEKGGSRKSRGWGIGLVKNDSQVRGFAIPSSETGLPSPHTTIILRPFEAMRKSVEEFVTRSFIPRTYEAI